MVRFLWVDKALTEDNFLSIGAHGLLYPFLFGVMPMNSTIFHFFLPAFLCILEST